MFKRLLSICPKFFTSFRQKMYYKYSSFISHYSEKKDTAKDAVKVKRLMDLPSKEPEASTSTGKSKKKSKDGIGLDVVGWDVDEMGWVGGVG